MDSANYITVEAERKPGQHLQREERGAIQRRRRLGYSNHAVAREINCSPTTVGNELRRGTPPRKYNKGRVPGYNVTYTVEQKQYKNVSNYKYTLNFNPEM